MITILFVILLILSAIVGLLYLFKFKKEKVVKHEKKGDEVGALDFAGVWWGKKDADAKKWFWYIAIAVIAITASYIVPEKLRYVVAGVIVLVGLHIVWLTYSEKTGLLTKIIIAGFLGFYVAVWLLPDVITIRDAKWSVVKKAVADVANNAKHTDLNYGKATQAVAPQAQPQIVVVNVPVAYRRTTAPVVTDIELTPVWSKEVFLPSGTRISFYCSESGAEVAILYSSAGNMNVPSGQAFNCPTDPNDHSLVGTNVRNARCVFRSKKNPGIVATIIW